MSGKSVDLDAMLANLAGQIIACGVIQRQIIQKITPDLCPGAAAELADLVEEIAAYQAACGAQVKMMEGQR